MREYSLAALVLLLVMFVDGGRAGGIEQRQSKPALNTNWKQEKHDLQDQLFGSFKSRVLHITGEKEPSEQPRPLSLRRMTRSTEKLLGVCDCSLSAHPSVCNYDIEEFGPIIINGKCLYSKQRRRRLRRRFVESQDNVTFSSPKFPDVPWCESTRPLLLVSSGEKRNLHLSNVPAVWICPRSLGSPLQQLVITNVTKVEIAPGALAQRVSDFTLSLIGIHDQMVFPGGALSVEAVEIQNVDDTSTDHIENVMEHHHLPQVKVLIENAFLISFRTKSVVAPRVWVEVLLMRTLDMESQAVEALASSSDSALHVSSTKLLRMKTRAAIVNSLWVINTSMVRLTEESVVVMAPRSEVILRNVADVIAPERAIILGDGATLELSNVFFPSNSDRALLSLSPLRSVMLRDVKVVGSNTTSICLATHALSLRGVTALSNESSLASVCLRYVTGMEQNTTEESRVVMCQDSSMEETADPGLCADPRCISCRDPRLTKQSPIPRQRPVPTYTTAAVNEAEPSEDAGEHWWQKPDYIAPAVAIAVLVLVLFSCCVYHTYKRCKHRKDAHEFPRTYRDGTFSRTIITQDNLSKGAVEGLLDGRYHQSDSPALHEAAALAQHQPWEAAGISPSGPVTASREKHPLLTFHPHDA